MHFLRPYVFLMVVLVGGDFDTLTLGQQRGSLAEYQQSVDAEQRATQANIAWRESKKLWLVEDRAAIDSKPSFHPMNFDSLSIGDVGPFHHIFRVSYIVDESRCVLMLGRGLAFYCLTNYPTKELTDGQLVALVGLVEVCDPIDLPTGKVKGLRFLSAEQTTLRERNKRDATAQEVVLKTGSKIRVNLIEFKKGEYVLQDLDGAELRLKPTDLEPTSDKSLRKVLKQKIEEQKKSAVNKSNVRSK